MISVKSSSKLVSIALQITHQVYEDCEARETYHALLSTRHYGPMVFYFVFGLFKLWN